jgi:hypothetical protein
MEKEEITCRAQVYVDTKTGVIQVSEDVGKIYLSHNTFL